MLSSISESGSQDPKLHIHTSVLLTLHQRKLRPMRKEPGQRGLVVLTGTQERARPISPSSISTRNCPPLLCPAWSTALVVGTFESREEGCI